MTIYMDDVVAYGKDAETHDARLQAVLNRMTEVGLKLNREKCKFRQKLVEFLGHEISRRGVKISGKKVAAVESLQAPNKQETAPVSSRDDKLPNPIHSRSPDDPGATERAAEGHDSVVLGSETRRGVHPDQEDDRRGSRPGLLQRGPADRSGR